MTIIETGEFTEHLLPGGGVVHYRDRDHSYWQEVVNGKGKGRLTGVSTVVSPFDWRPDNLMRWASRINLDGVAALFNAQSAAGDMAGIEWLMDGDAIDARLKEHALHYTQERDKAAARGTGAHLHALQALADGRAVPAFDEIPEAERGYAQAVAGWWLDTDPTPLHTELVVADLDLSIAGRLDLIYTDAAGDTVLLDLKTSKYLSAKLAVQAALYAHCYAVSGYGTVDRVELLQAGEDGDYTVVPVDVFPEDVLAAVAVYRAAARINGQIRRASK